MLKCKSKFSVFLFSFEFTFLHKTDEKNITDCGCVFLITMWLATLQRAALLYLYIAIVNVSEAMWMYAHFFHSVFAMSEFIFDINANMLASVAFITFTYEFIYQQKKKFTFTETPFMASYFKHIIWLKSRDCLPNNENKERKKKENKRTKPKSNSTRKKMNIVFTPSPTKWQLFALPAFLINAERKMYIYTWNNKRWPWYWK